MSPPRQSQTARTAFLGGLALAMAATAWTAPLRVATFNVEWGLGSPGSASFENSAPVLQRIGADVVAMQELISDSPNLSALGDRLSLPHVAYQSSSSMSVGLLSKYPLSPPVWISRSEMTRPILLVQVDVPGVLRDPWIAVVHLKCCNDYGTEQYTRAVELYYLRKEITQRIGPGDPVLIMGDFNLVAPDDVTYTTGPEGVSPFPAPADADGYFVPQEIFKLDARHAGGGGETWTWRSNGRFPNGPLDHIMANFAVRARGTSVEIYNAEKDAAGISGLPKVGSPLAASFAYASDHLPIFADIQLESSAPVINVSPQSLTGFTSVPGEPSPPQSAVVSGSNLASRIMATAPSGYEVSLAANGSYADSVDLIPSGGTIGPTAIFVRLKAGAPGTFQGDLQITSSGANPLNVALTGVTFASGALEVDSSAALDAEGPISGPFAPEAGTYVLRNSGAQPLEWTAEHDADWLALSATSGVLAPGDSFAVTAHLTPAASLLPVGSHRTILRFTNQTNDLGTTTAQASVFVGSFAMDGIADAPGYTVSPAGITLSVAVRGTKLYVATRVPPAASGAEDHHIFIADSLLPDATAPAPWAKRGLVAIDTTKPYLAAEGENKWSGWFQAPAGARLHRSTNGTGVLEGSIDLFPLPEFIYIAVVAYETRHAADQDASAGRVVSQVPLAVVPDDDITPDEFLKIPVRSITDSVGDGRFDALAPGRGFAAQIIPGSAGQAPELRWPTVPWRNYTVLRKSDLTSSVWEPIHSMKAGVHTWELSLPDAHGAERGFYKVEVFEPGF